MVAAAGDTLEEQELVVLAAAWELLQRERRRGEGVSLYDLTKVLAKLKEQGVDIRLRFIEYSFGPYSPDLEQLLEDMARRGLGDYEVEVHIPRAPSDGVDPDYAWAIIEHQLSERDADRKYVKKTFIPKVPVENLPREVSEKIHAAVDSYLEERTRSRQSS